jgi:hypothetical protein
MKQEALESIRVWAENNPLAEGHTKALALLDHIHKLEEKLVEETAKRMFWEAIASEITIDTVEWDYHKPTSENIRKAARTKLKGEGTI